MSYEMLLATRKEKVSAFLDAIFSSTTDYRRLLHCSETDAQKILDAFQKLLDSQSFQDRKQIIAAMCRFSKGKDLYPTQLYLKDPPKKLEDDPINYGSFGEVYKISFKGKIMCFKVIKKYQNISDEHMKKVYAKEAIPWAQLSHPNILPFYGLAMISSRVAFVSPWAANGNLKDYLDRNPGANRLLLCADTAAGMEYLHQNHIVHGDLKGLNVLIDSGGRAALCDFGLSSVTDPEILKWTTQSTMASKGGTVPWQAPELFMDQEDQSNGVRNTKESDIFAWAGVCYEIFTGCVPYYEISNQVSVMHKILQGKIPTCPEDGNVAWHKHGLTQQMWGLMEECWAFQASERPSASAVVTRLEGNRRFDTRKHGEWMEGLAMRFRRGEGVGDVGDVVFWEELDSLLARVILTEDEARTRMLVARKQEKVMAFLTTMFSTTTGYRRLLQCSKFDAQKILDAFQTMLDTDSFPDRTQMILAMYRFARDRDLYPTQLSSEIPRTWIGDRLKTASNFAAVYKVRFEGKDICLKTITIGGRSDVCARSIILWAQLSHQNILPFHGFIFPLALVSPWAANGNLKNYLCQNPGADRLLLCADTAAGLEYLHQNDIVHGNLQGSNVLIDSAGRAALGGFGISGLANPQIFERNTQSTMMASKGGTVRWQAPELRMVNEDLSDGVCNTKEGDVYAWACVCYEIFTGHDPFHEFPNQMSVMLSVLRDRKPTRPEASDAAWHKHGLTQQMWRLMEECWASQASKRPSASAVVTRLKKIVGPDTREPGEWTDGAMRFRRGEEVGDVRDVNFWEDLISLLTRLVPGLKERYTT